MSRRHFEGGKGWSGSCSNLLSTVARGGPVQLGVLSTFCLFARSLSSHENLKAIWKRQISMLRRLGQIENAVVELCKFADTFYTDVEAWLELADIYASNHQYASYYRQPELALHLDTELDMPRLYSLCPTSCYSHPKTRFTCSRPRKRHTQLKTFRWP